MTEHDSEMVSGSRKARLKKYVFWIGLALALIGIGAWQGDYTETLLNGTSL